MFVSFVSVDCFEDLLLRLIFFPANVSNSTKDTLEEVVKYVQS